MKYIMMIFILLSNLSLFGYYRSVAVVDLSTRYSETKTGIYSIRQSLQVAGVPFTETTDITSATESSVIILADRISTGILTSAEKTVLTHYVSNGGTLLACVVTDTDLYSLFGITGYTSDRTKHTMTWNVGSLDPTLNWFDDDYEITISLGSEEYNTYFNTYSYTLNTASTLANYSDGSISASKNIYGNGTTYLMGIQWKDIIHRSLANKDSEAQRAYANIFEPTVDTFYLWMREIYNQANPYGVYKHTSPANTKSSLLVTHDVDWGQSYNLMNTYAAWEAKMGFKAEYFMTTHYFSDYNDGDYYTTKIPYIQAIGNSQHSAGSHSVGHFPDFMHEDIFPKGTRGNKRSTYAPHYNGTITLGNGTVFGEFEVSKNLLENEGSCLVKSFRAGHLYNNDYEAEVSESLGYKYNSSFSSIDQLNNFPHYLIYNNSSSGHLSSILQLGITISDDYMDFALNYDAYMSNWKSVFTKLRNNSAPCCLLIHPTVTIKLQAEQEFYNWLPWDTAVMSLTQYMDFWKLRETTQTESYVYGDTLYLSLSTLTFPTELSWVVKGGSTLGRIVVLNSNGTELPYEVSAWNENDLLIHNAGNYSLYTSQLANPSFPQGTTLEFNDVNPGNFTAQNLQIANSGNYPLVIYNIQKKNSSSPFSFSFSPFVVYQESIKNINITFQPAELGTYSDSLIITTNHPDTPTMRIQIQGTAVEETLPAPQNLQIMPSGDRINLSWDEVNVRNRTNLVYRVYLAESATLTNAIVLGETSETSISFSTSVLKNRQGTFFVTAKREN